MSKLFVFGIGGTGSRVLRSLTMLLASGVQSNMDIVPIIIDRDASNEDLTRTENLIKNYASVHEISITGEKNQFFKTKISPLETGLHLQLADNTQQFDAFLGRNTMSLENKALVDMLFTKRTLKLNMTDGFQGNPNMGSVVLNQFNNSDVFQQFAQQFQSGDRIIIISSIFGGTGASGFPLLRKTLHTPNVKDAQGNNLNNWGLVNKAPIASVSVLPYFKVGSPTDDSLVDSDTFIDKAKAALNYYKAEDGKLDAMYYIADQQPSTYAHSTGGKTQKNNAHFTELASALAVIDFVNNIPDSQIKRETNENRITTYKEFGLNSGDKTINLGNLTDKTTGEIVDSLTQFMLFTKYLGYEVGPNTAKSIYEQERKNQPYTSMKPWQLGKKRFDKNFINQASIKTLRSFQSEFVEWLNETKNQEHSFNPFNLNKEGINFIHGEVNVIDRGNWSYKGWAMLENTLNKEVMKLEGDLSFEQQFMELFYRGTNALIKQN